MTPPSTLDPEASKSTASGAAPEAGSAVKAAMGTCAGTVVVPPPPPEGVVVHAAATRPTKATIATAMRRGWLIRR